MFVKVLMSVVSNTLRGWERMMDERIVERLSCEWKMSRYAIRQKEDDIKKTLFYQLMNMRLALSDLWYEICEFFKRGK